MLLMKAFLEAVSFTLWFWSTPVSEKGRSSLATSISSVYELDKELVLSSVRVMLMLWFPAWVLSWVGFTVNTWLLYFTNGGKIVVDRVNWSS